MRELLDDEARKKRLTSASSCPRTRWGGETAHSHRARAAARHGLDAVLVQHAQWVGSRPESRRELEAMPERLPDARIPVRETCALIRNYWPDYAVRNAAALRDLLAGLAGG
jgi:hypothetical protein